MREATYRRRYNMVYRLCQCQIRSRRKLHIDDMHDLYSSSFTAQLIGEMFRIINGIIEDDCCVVVHIVFKRHALKLQ